MSMLKNRKAISPVIATVILVAVAITIAVAVSYWMGGITSQYTKFEKVEIQSAYAVKTVESGWTVTLQVKNTGSAASTLSSVFINERPLNSTGYHGAGVAFADLAANTRVATDIPATGLVIAQGASQTVIILIGDTAPSNYASLSSGTTINVKIHSAGGMDYIKLLELV